MEKETNMKPDRNEKGIIQFTMRIDTKLYKIIVNNAQRFKRSIAKEIEYELEEYNRDLNK